MLTVNTTQPVFTQDAPVCKLTGKSHFVVLASYVKRATNNIICYINANPVPLTSLLVVAEYNCWT